MSRTEPSSDYGQRMDDGAVAQVRRFNRTVTQRIGAREDAFHAPGPRTEAVLRDLLRTAHRRARARHERRREATPQ